MGIVFSVSLIITALIISSLRPLISHSTRLAYLLIVSTASVSVINLLTQAVFYQLHQFVHIYLPMIVMNCLVLYFLEADALKFPPRYIIKSSCYTSFLILIICVLVGLLREIFVTGGLFLKMETAVIFPETGIKLLPSVLNMSIFNTASGAFIIAGCIFALINILLAINGSE